MEATCKKGDCTFWDKKKGCPLMVQTAWQPALPQGGKPEFLDDCAPRRTMFMVQDLYNRLIGTQQAVEEMRNENAWVQVVAEVLGKNSGINLEAFVQERQRLSNIEKLKRIKP